MAYEDILSREEERKIEGDVVKKRAPHGDEGRKGSREEN